VQDEVDSVNRKEYGRELLLGLSDQDWKDLIDRLRLFANSRYYNLDADDLVMEAIEAVMARRRSWNSTKPAFYNFCSIIRSIASNQLEKEKRFTPLAFDTQNSSTNDAPLMLPPISSHAETHEQLETDESFRSQLEQALHGDSLSLQLADYLIDDPTAKPEKIADDLGEWRGKIYNARKRLLRKLIALMEVRNRLYEK
jgi:DNA-directed RNA polymerase specialized sigma24 family protein